ncbi:Methylcrotonoyl-CoA carboxylase subunit alpha, mitochondrial [Neonectria ditissima]|uniref:Methylcrotonoyl-CoA carboxylase subunit alpha, mitochondrial n=1 Tax=Neonectria ditissima TaxID=78410 RepID=A0A0P7ASK0_9HYPO|nr:Methylcrotonoyl-CoA carboxylase subunit alpha, mitochondrial [Neonectria ditissima]
MSTNLEACPPRQPLFVAPIPIDAATGLPVIRKILIANRGEIACRIIATCQKLNVQTALIYVQEDEGSLHITEANDAVNVGSINDHTTNPFLNIPLLIQTALDLEADAIHPGYGYLSENAEFASRVAEAGLIFIGPSPSAMSTLGDKRSSKKYLEENAPEVPLIPGFSGTSVQVDDLEQAAATIGYPIMLKASAGGGGKGMRIVREASQLREELERVQSEAARSFGSSDCILEKYVENSKHIEVQIMGDSHGNVISFFERDCSVQRRHQKVIEESPCSFLSDDIRLEMGRVAVRVAKIINYANAGTVEFVFDVKTRKFFFLEVNARLQVEHPITEEVTRTDLVALQLFVAAGGDLGSLPHLQSIRQVGHAIECRLCAEDAQRDFFPEHGKIIAWLPAQGTLKPGRDIRYETAVQDGYSVSIYFDSMIAKLVVWAPTRSMAVQKMADVVAQTVCIGIKTNQLFLQRCLLNPAFQDLAYNTSFIPRHLSELLHAAKPFSRELAVIPSIFLRALAHKASNAKEPRPFQNVRSQFRNQYHDPVNVRCDAVTSDLSTFSDGDEKQSTLFIWQPGSRQHGKERDRVSIVPIDDLENGIDKEKGGDDEPAAKIMARQYNGVSNILRKHTLSPIEASLLSWKTLGPVSILEAVVNQSKIRAYCIAPAYKSNQSGPQAVFCHFPHLGCHIQFRKDTMLSYTESRRASFQAQKEQGQEDIKAPMPCKVLSVKKKNGDEVKGGELVMVIESMKMEVSIKANKDGEFHTLWKDGDAADEGAILCRII